MSRTWILCMTVFVAAVSGCSIPTLETDECTEARPSVREFYSFHFGNDMAFTPENLAAREKYLTRDFFEKLKGTASANDPFTGTSADDPPKAFRVGECTTVETGRKAAYEVLLFWKTDDRTEQRKINANAEKENGEWRISIDQEFDRSN